MSTIEIVETSRHFEHHCGLPCETANLLESPAEVAPGSFPGSPEAGGWDAWDARLSPSSAPTFAERGTGGGLSGDPESHAFDLP